MLTRTHKTTKLGDLVVAAFDKAARCSVDPREVSRLATQSVTSMLRSARRLSLPTAWPMGFTAGADL